MMNTAALSFLSASDEVLSDIISTLDLPDHNSSGNVFHDLMSCIIEQQIHYRSTKNIFARLLEKASLTELTPDNFPVFEEMALPGIKISMSKLETILRVVQFWQQNTVDWAGLTDEEIRNTLGSIKGIGAWTIDMILLYTLERTDVFPTDDYRLKLIMERLYGLDPKSRLKAQMNNIAEKWRPHRSVATLYLLAFKKMNPK